MQDTRTSQMAALIDDAWCLAADMADENITESERIHLLSVRAALNSAARSINILKGDTSA